MGRLWAGPSQGTSGMAGRHLVLALGAAYQLATPFIASSLSSPSPPSVLALLAVLARGSRARDLGRLSERTGSEKLPWKNGKGQE